MLFLLLVNHFFRNDIILGQLVAELLVALLTQSVPLSVDKNGTFFDG